MDVENYRGISITATLARLIPMIILERLRSSYNTALNQTQCGLWPNKGCDDVIWILRIVIDLTPETYIYVLLAWKQHMIKYENVSYLNV